MYRCDIPLYWIGRVGFSNFIDILLRVLSPVGAIRRLKTVQTLVLSISIDYRPKFRNFLWKIEYSDSTQSASDRPYTVVAPQAHEPSHPGSDTSQGAR